VKGRNLRWATQVGTNVEVEKSYKTTLRELLENPEDNNSIILRLILII
jgi:hypothetical protein